jgi:hypothetical protein
MQKASMALVVVVFALAIAQSFGAEYVGTTVLRNKFADTVVVSGAAGITVNFTFDNNPACNSKPAGADGKASCKFTPVVTTLGPHTLGWSASDGSHGSQSVILYEFPVGGAFVIGDATASNGGAVTFFGDNWRASQQFSGSFSGNAKQFIGWIDDDKGSSVFHLPGWCAALWKHGGAQAPAHLPSYMGVVYASTVEQIFGFWFGNIRGVAVVTNIHYTPSTKKVDGTGTGNVVGVQKTWISLKDLSCHDCTSCPSFDYQTPHGACGTFADTQCAACDASCKTCSAAGPSACTSCPQTNQYVNAQSQCQTCPSTCATCALVGSNVQCVTCAAGLSGPDNNGVCSNPQPQCTGALPDGGGTTADPQLGCRGCAVCGPGTYQSAGCTPTQDTTCLPCDSTCAQCLGAGPEMCTACFQNPGASQSLITDGGYTGHCIVCTEGCLTCIDESVYGCTFCDYDCTFQAFNSLTGSCTNCIGAAYYLPNAAVAIEGGLTAETVTHTVLPVVLVPVGLAIIAASWLLCFKRRKAAQPAAKVQRPSSSKAVDDGSSHGLKEEGVSVNVAVAVTPSA